MNKWIAEFDLEDGDTMPEHMDLNYMGAQIDFHCRPMWIPCSERLPETDKKVLVNLHNTYGKDVILMASHIGYHERTSEDYGWQEYEGDTEYDEENDCFWIPECWYESNYVEDNANWIIDECEGTITHWMPLPETYKKEGESE